MCAKFFTTDIVRSIRKSKWGFDIKNWYLYREYHVRNKERVHSKNAIFLFKEFQNACETIAGFNNNDAHVRNFLLNL